MEARLFNRKDLEERMPDYIFGRLPKVEFEIFEQSLQNFPDLIQEIEDVRKVFSKLEQSDLNKFVERKTRNIPVKVAKKLQQRKAPFNILARPAFVTIVASFAIILLTISIFISKNQHQEIVQTQKTNNYLALQDTTPLFPQLESIEQFANNDDLNLSYFSNFNSSNIFEISHYSEAIADYLEKAVNEQIVDFLGSDAKPSPNIFDFDIFKRLDNLDESDFQQIIEELKHVEI